MALRVLAFVVIAVGVGLAINDAAVGGSVFLFLLLVLIGGGAGAAMMIMRGRRPHDAPLSVPDAFTRDQPEGIINVSRIRVAGVGGLGMVAVAATMALTIPAIGLALGLGLVGGFLVAVALVPYRRAHAGRRS